MNSDQQNLGSIISDGNGTMQQIQIGGNGSGTGVSFEGVDLLSTVVSQSAIDTGHEMVVEGTSNSMTSGGDNLQMLQPLNDFSSLVGMDDIQIAGDEILVHSSGSDGHPMVVQHHEIVGNSIEISSSGGQQQTQNLMQSSQVHQIPTQHYHHQSNILDEANLITETIPSLNSGSILTTTIEPAPPEQSNLSLSSDVIMFDDSSSIGQASNLIQPQQTQHYQQIVTSASQHHATKSIPQQTQQGTILPTIVTPNTAHIIAAAAAAQQPVNTTLASSSSGSSKTQVLSIPKLNLSTNNQTQVQLAPLKIATSSTGQTSQQQPIFVTNQILGSGMQTLQAGNISYILPPNATLGKPLGLKTASGGPSLASIGNTTFVINQIPGSKSGTGTLAPTANLKLVQTSQGQQLILAAPFKSISSSTGSQKTSSLPVSIKSAPIGQKGSTSQAIPTIQLQTGSQAQLLPVGTQLANSQNSQNQLIILSPVKPTTPVVQKQSTFAVPAAAAMKLFSQPSTSSGSSSLASKLQTIAPAPSKSQRVIAPAPVASKSSSGSISTGSAKPIQTLVHSGGAKNVQYISFVPMSSANQIQNQTQTKLITAAGVNPNATKLLPLKSSIGGSSKIGTGNSNATLKPTIHLTGLGGGQKLLITNPNSIKITNTSGSSISGSGSITSGTGMVAQKISTGSLTAGGKPTSIWMLPKNQVIKVDSGSIGGTSSLSGSTFQIQTTKPLPTACTPASKFVPIAPHPLHSAGGGVSAAGSATAAAGSTGTAQEHKALTANATPKLVSNSNASDSFIGEEARRKPCNCTRSQCLKLYCDCFANGEFCNNCNCVSCCNNLMHEETRQKAIRLCLDRNPNAFHPKIGQNTHQGDGERKHTKGCCCKRSGCLKNYCECYEAKILCSDKCKCVGCKNFEESTERKTLMHLADAAEFRSVQQAYTSKVQIWGPDLKLKLPVKVKSDTHPFNIFTMDILEATACCMLAQGEEGEYENYTEENIESLILDQFGECFSQILNMASNNGLDTEMESDDEDQTQTSSAQNSQNSTDDQYHHNEMFERT